MFLINVAYISIFIYLLLFFLLPLLLVHQAHLPKDIGEKSNQLTVIPLHSYFPFERKSEVMLSFIYEICCKEKKM